MEAYGNLYTASYGGIVRCYSMTTGNLQWSYNNTVVGLAAVWPNWPVGMAAIADGKVYAFTSEHSPNAPPYKGAKVRAINATTGEEIWTMMGWMSGFQAAGAACAVADGILTFLNLYDMQIYGIGKGPSATTVEAPMTSNELGKPIVIRGTVTDIAAGTRQKEQAARFPNGVPAVSEQSMSAWMEHVYMQKPRPSEVVGVDVSLFVLDANNNYREIGKTTTDADGFFSYRWTPDIDGAYTVYALFDGSESYWPSHAVTSFAVDPAVATATPQPTQAQSMGDQYFMPMSIAIIVALVVVGALLALLLLRKRP
jgi:outer membrane protein assembly factor BamB